MPQWWPSYGGLYVIMIVSHRGFQPEAPFSRTSTSSSSMTPSTTVRLSMNPFTATRNILLVVALYSVRNTVFSCPGAEPFAISVAGGTMENDLRTSGESSLSTCRACMADEASLSVGRGRSMTLQMRKVSSCAMFARVRNLQGAGELRIPFRRHRPCW
jgi:hypothetical protein